jgi:hypothetical protein
LLLCHMRKHIKAIGKAYSITASNGHNGYAYTQLNNLTRGCAAWWRIELE